MLNIIYEDEALLICNKPAGLPVFSSKQADDPSLARALVEKFPDLADIPENGIAHRLDNDTSGLVCVGKTLESYENLRKRFSEGGVKKEYAALVIGAPPENGTVDAPIAHHPRKTKKMVVCESEARAREMKGRRAHTEFNVAARYEFIDCKERRPYALLRVVISTGVRHQIRAHLAWKGFPIAGDRLYQNSKIRGEDALPLSRHFLHASHLEIVHPVTNERLSFDCELPEDLKSTLEKMRI